MPKRLFDIAGAAAGIVLLSPVLVAVALTIRLLLGRPVMFRQVRSGHCEKPFTMYKFRTMRDATDSQGHLLPDRERLLPVGTFLRRTSLDELPEFWNVLRGDMSLVGPRPLLPEYLPRYTIFQRRRHAVKPGITGWAQVNGRNALTWERKFELDTWYVDHRCLRLDLKILALTVKQVLRRDGISQRGYATAPEFLGNEETSTAK
jgi:lipopolysaccharide/colanic/teichoic acid biosynthesis glycosyltransferase